MGTKGDGGGFGKEKFLLRLKRSFISEEVRLWIHIYQDFLLSLSEYTVFMEFFREYFNLLHTKDPRF